LHKGLCYRLLGTSFREAYDCAASHMLNLASQLLFPKWDK